MRKNLILLLFIFFAGLVSAQTIVTIPDTAYVANSSLYIPIFSTPLNNIGSMDLTISFDPSVIEVNKDSLVYNSPFLGIGTLNVNISQDTLIRIGWFSGTSVNVTDRLMNLKFKYKGGESDLKFVKTNALTDDLAVKYAVTFNNGSVSETIVLPNSAPVFTQELPDTTINEGAAFTFNYLANDPDSDPLTFTLLEGPTGAVLSAAGVFSWTPTYDDEGIYDVKVIVSDGTLSDTSNTAKISVTNVQSNNPPKFTQELSDITISEGDAFTFTYLANDPDSDPLTFTLLEGPTGAILSTAGVFNWTPTYDDEGTYDVKVMVSDGSLSDTTEVAVITVINNNRAPEFTDRMPDQTVEVHNVPVEFSYQYLGNDPDGEDVTFSFDSGPVGSSVTNDGLFTWSPTEDQAGGIDYQVIVNLTDGTATIADTAVLTSSVTVTGIEDNNIPTEFTLSQNYPNPFNPTTTIQFGLPAESNVIVKVYDLLGQEVSTVVNEVLSAGFHSYQFDASKINSGVYLYRIEASEFVSINKMVLIK